MKEKYSEIRNPYDGLRFYSALTHAVGIILSIVGMIFLLIKARTGGTAQIGALLAYSITMLALYTASTVYHSAKVSVPARLRLRKLDHAMIYVFIAGTYTPLCIISLSGTAATALFIATWTVGLAGMLLTIFWISMPRSLTAAIYIAMGWMAVFAAYPLVKACRAVTLILLLAGGVFYTVGGVMYAKKWPGRENPRFGCHEVFHVFVLLGSMCHYAMMYTIIA